MNNNFGEFLYVLRKEKGLTQAELGEKLNVTNKAVSKWETGESYPETSMLIPLSTIFNISVDELLKGERIAGGEDKKKETFAEVSRIKPMTKSEALLITSAIVLIMVGVLLLVTFSLINEKKSIIYLPILLSCVSVAVFILVSTGIKKRLRSAELNEDINKKGKTIIYLLALGISITILSVIPLITMASFGISAAVYWPLFFGMLIAGVALIVYNGIMWDNFVKKNNVPQEEEALTGKAKRIEELACSVIMLTSTGLFFLFGFLLGKWHPAWVAFPIGGILCGIASTIIKGTKKDGENN